MKKMFILINLLLPLSLNSFASYSTDWIKSADSYLKSGSMIALDKADNVIVTGYIQTDNIYTRKYDKFGNFLWEKTSSSGIPDNYEKPMWVNCDQNKNIYVVGYRYNWSLSWEYPNAIVVLKYDAAGILLWKKNIDLFYVVGSSTGKKFNLKSELDKKGNLYIGTAGTSPSGFVLIKLNSSGIVLVNTSINLGTIHGFASMRLKDSRVVLTGTAEYTSTLAIVAWDTTGNLLWSKLISDGFTGKDVELDGNGNAYLLTMYPNQVSPTSGNDIVIYKFNDAGVQKWKKYFDFGGEEGALRFTFVSGKLSVIGFGSVNPGYYTDWITFQLDKNGNKLWDARYNEATGYNEQPYALAANANGEVFVTGGGGPIPGMVTLKYGNTGTVQWADTTNYNSGSGFVCTLAADSSLFVMNIPQMTVFHLLDHTGIGSCGIPTNLIATSIKDTSVKISWATVAGAYLYHLRYKTTSAADWNTMSTNLTSIKIKTLTEGTSYTYCVEAVCSSGPSGYSTSMSFVTTGTGYCTTGGMSTDLEYLTLVWIGSIQNSTGNNNGYADYTNLITNLIQGSMVTGNLKATLPPGLSEYYSIWIDFNHNNDFSDVGEQVVNISSPFLGWIGINFSVPSNAMLGITRMRVTMEYGVPPAPCGTYERGETEDYTVNIMAPKMSVSSETITGLIPRVTLFTNPVGINLTAKFSDFEGSVTAQVFELTGKLIFVETLPCEDLMQMDVHDLSTGNYILIASDGHGNKAFTRWTKE